jgi:predicted  nucleic acid-binding Zn-ribbon protein
MKTYCSDCGFKIEFVSKKPNFCPNCGIGSTTKKAPPKPTPEDEKSAIAETSLGLEYDFEPDSQNSETLGSIFKRASIDVKPTVDASPRGEGPTVQQNMDQFKAEAGTLRQKNSE